MELYFVNPIIFSIFANEKQMFKKNKIMTKEEKELLLSLLSRLDEDGLLNIYDDEENHHEVKDREELCKKIKL